MNMSHIELRRRPPLVRALSWKHAVAFEDPSRLHLVRRERLAEHRVDERGDAADVIGVEDVRVLVRDELEVPVVDVAERGHVLGRRDEQADRVVRQRGRRAVRALGSVDEQDLRLVARGA